MMRVGKEKKEESSVLFAPARWDLEEKVLRRGKSLVGLRWRWKRGEDLVGEEKEERRWWKRCAIVVGGGGEDWEGGIPSPVTSSWKWNPTDMWIPIPSN